MTDNLTHRGPNGEGFWADESVSLGHRRLSIVGLGEQGRQPMTIGHLTLVYNGELYNFRSLRGELACLGDFHTATDTEVVLRAWHAWGERALERFSGMYAFAIWDARDQRLWLARDRVGIKPLYYSWLCDGLIFASEVEALLHCEGAPRTPNLEALRHQLLCSSTLECDETRTLIEGVQSLAPGSILVVDVDGTRRARQYWCLPPSEGVPIGPPRLAEELSELLRSSVEQMLIGDVPVSSFLSGGLDSSAIVALASPRTKLKCVTIAYEDEGGGCAAPEAQDDLYYSRLLIDSLPHPVDHEVLLRSSDITIDDVDSVCDLAVLADDPRHVHILANYRCVAALGLRVVLNGQGADEIMGGYVGLPGFRRNVLDVNQPCHSLVQRMPASRRAQALSPETQFQAERAEADVFRLYAELAGDPIERVHRLLFRTQLARVLKFEDHLSMQASVEARVPLLDHELVEWCFRQDFCAHIDANAGQGKAIMREALRHHLPAALLSRPKQVFPFPDRARLQRSLATLVERHHDDIRIDSLVGDLLSLPGRETLGALSVQTLWTILAVWRWSEKLRRLARVQ